MASDEDHTLLDKTLSNKIGLKDERETQENSFSINS